MIDTHAHIDQLEDLPAALKSAQDSGVDSIVAVSMDVSSCRKNLEIKRTYEVPRIYLAFGVHPSEANVEQAKVCEGLIREHRSELTAIGEVGLDFWYKWVKKDDAKKEEQVSVFKVFAGLAKEFELPLIVHARGAWKESLAIVREMGVRKVNFHWYSGPLDVLDEIIAAGYYISASPSVAYSAQSRAAVAHAPLDRVMIETDCPVFYKNFKDETDAGFQAQPKDVFRTLDAISELKQMDRADAAAKLTSNAESFFNIK